MDAGQVDSGAGVLFAKWTFGGPDNELRVGSKSVRARPAGGLVPHLDALPQPSCALNGIGHRWELSPVGEDQQVTLVSGCVVGSGKPKR